jgi:hypothetical protein
VGLLLLFCAVVEDGRADHGDAHSERDRIVAADPGQLLLHDPALGDVEAAAAIGGRPGRRGPALGAHALFPELGVADDRITALDLGHAGAAAAQGLGEVGFEPFAGLGPEGVEFEIGRSVAHQCHTPMRSDEG